MFLRSALFVGSGTRKDGILKTVFDRFFPSVSFPGAGRRICRFLRVAGLLGVVGFCACEDAFEGGEYVSSSGTGAAGWGEDNLGGPLHDFENSVVDGVASNVLGDANIVVAAVRRGECFWESFANFREFGLRAPC